MARSDEQLTIINARVPNRRWSRPYAITVSDTIASANLKRNGVPFKWIQNLGTGGLVMIAWQPDGALLDVYLAQGEIMEMGLPLHLMSTGTTAVGPFRGFLGIEGNWK